MIIFKKIVVSVMIFSLMLMMISCGKTTVVGTWKGQENNVEITYVFNKDGTGKLETMGASLDFVYEIEENKLNINLFGDSFEYEYELEKNKLKLTKNDETTVFFKQ